MTHDKTRNSVAIGAVLALAISVSAASASGPKQPRTLRVVAKTLVQTGPTTPPAAGDRYVFYESDTGGERGHDYFDCVVTNPQGEAFCVGEFVLKHGDISTQGVVNFNQATLHSTGVITGGTGRYAAAKGYAIARGPATSTRFTFHFAQ